MDFELWPGSMSSEGQSRAQAAELLPRGGQGETQEWAFLQSLQVPMPLPQDHKVELLFNRMEESVTSWP